MKISIKSYLVFLLALLIYLWTSPGQALTKQELTRRHQGDAVEIALTYMNPLGQAQDGNLTFEMRMNTHSVELDQYQMEKLSFLKDDQGNEYPALGLFSPGGGGHHRYGMLKFAPKAKEGREIAGQGRKYFQVIIRDVAGVKERSFRWDLPLKP
jgi:hypothetical protein